LCRDRFGTVIAMAITSQKQFAGFPLTLELPASAGLPEVSWVKDQPDQDAVSGPSWRMDHATSTGNQDQLIGGLSEIVAG
jgi:mRNA interferase MazF